MQRHLFYLAILAAVCSVSGIALAEEMEDAGDIVEFHIAPGTRLKPWNTPETTIHVRVGQILRIVNDDSVPHRLHTTDNKPCEHQPESSRPGEFYDCVIINPADPAVDFMYEHNVGGNARFYVQATP